MEHKPSRPDTMLSEHGINVGSLWLLVASFAMVPQLSVQDHRLPNTSEYSQQCQDSELL